jgi:hypothetical protein
MDLHLDVDAFRPSRSGSSLARVYISQHPVLKGAVVQNIGLYETPVTLQNEQWLIYHPVHIGVGSLDMTTQSLAALKVNVPLLLGTFPPAGQSSQRRLVAAH